MSPLDDCWVPTPDDLANHMVSLAGFSPRTRTRTGEPELEVFRVLEPSAGMGSITEAILHIASPVHVVSVELDLGRYEVLKNRKLFAGRSCQTTILGDFLRLNQENLGEFDAVVMSPPFHSENDPTADITHVRHAYSFLRPGGRLVAIMHPRLLDGSPRSQTFLLGLRRFEIEYLPRGTFPTHPHVEAVLLTHTKEAP